MKQILVWVYSLPVRANLKSGAGRRRRHHFPEKLRESSSPSSSSSLSFSSRHSLCVFSGLLLMKESWTGTKRRVMMGEWRKKPWTEVSLEALLTEGKVKVYFIAGWGGWMVDGNGIRCTRCCWWSLYSTWVGWGWRSSEWNFVVDGAWAMLITNAVGGWWLGVGVGIRSIRLDFKWMEFCFLHRWVEILGTVFI